MKRQIATLAVLALFLTACSSSAAPPTPDVAAIFTQAYQTVMASRPTNTASPLPPTSTPVPTQTPVPEYGTRTLPYPKGTTAHLTINSTLEFNATVLDVVRGTSAWNTIIAANQFNDAAPAGMEFVIMRIKIEYVGADKGALQLGLNDFAVVSRGKVVDFTTARPCCIQNSLIEIADLTLFPGGVADGYLAWPVYVDDSNPLLVIGLKHDGSGGIFFSLTN